MNKSNLGIVIDEDSLKTPLRLYLVCKFFLVEGIPFRGFIAFSLTSFLKNLERGPTFIPFTPPHCVRLRLNGHKYFTAY